MTNQKPAPDPNKPHAGRSEKLRNARTDTYSSVGRGIGEAPSSRMKKYGFALLVFLIALFIIMDFVDRANAKKEKAGSLYQPTADLQIHRPI
jgi:hypothetical protein